MGSSRMTLPVSHSRFRWENGLNEVWITPLLDTGSAQHFIEFGIIWYARADSRKTWRLLVHAHIGADLAQRGRGRHPTDARAHNGNGKLLPGHLKFLWTTNPQFAAPREKSGFYSEGRALVVSLPNHQPGRNDTLWKWLQPLKRSLITAPPNCDQK